MEKNKLMMIIIIALLVILLGSVGAVGFFAFRMLNADPSAATEEVAADPILDVADIQLFPLNTPISTNLKKGTDGSETHIIRANLSVGVNKSDEKNKEYQSLITLIPEKEAIISSLALNKMRTKTYEELTVSDGQSLLAEEILAVLQETFNTHLIVKVYISELILQ